MPLGPFVRVHSPAGRAGQDSGRWEGGAAVTGGSRDPEAVGQLEGLGRCADLCSENYRTLQDGTRKKRCLLKAIVCAKKRECHDSGSLSNLSTLVE